MKALVKTGPGEDQLELTDWPEPFPRADEVKLRIEAAGICGTDLHILGGRWPCRPPVVLGHEFCGTVVEKGARVRRLRPGDRVVASNPVRTCGRCRHCRRGNPFMCPERISAGYMVDGAFAEYLCIQARACHRLPDHISFRQAALGEPLAVAVRAVLERTKVRPGDLVVVSGPGCVGLLTSRVAHLQGATVIVTGIERDTRRLACARELGAEEVVDVTRSDPLEVVHRSSDGEGADLVYECAGSAPSLEFCWKAVRKEGTLVSLGVHPGSVNTDFNQVMMKELQVIGSYGYVSTSWKRCIRLWEERLLDVEGLVSHQFPLEDFRRAFEAARDGSAVKVIFRPSG